MQEATSTTSEPEVAVIVASIDVGNLPCCLSSMLDQSYSRHTIYVVDDSKGEEIQQLVSASFPSVRLIKTTGRTGYRKANSMAMRAVSADYVVVCNDDVEVHRDWLPEMIAALEANPRLGMVTPKILHFDRRDRINSAGNTLHFSGMYSKRGNDEPGEAYSTPEILATATGCCFAIRGELLAHLGGFSNDFDRLDTGHHASFEDLDLSWRAQLEGFEIGYVPTSIIYHRWLQKPITAEWYGTFEWGRTLVLMRNYGLSSLVILAPLLLSLEGLSWGLAASRGMPWLRAKWQIAKWLWTRRDDARAMREQVQARRRVDDLAIFERMSPTIDLRALMPNGSAGQVLNAVTNRALEGYYRAARLALRLLAKGPGDNRPDAVGRR